MMKTIKPLLVILVAILSAGQASAALKLYYSTGELNSGLGQASSNTFTNTIVTAFGGATNVVEVANFADTSLFSDASALFINPRATANILSTAEQANILAAINAGKPVFFIGEHTGWVDFNNSFLSLFGDTSVATTGAVNVGVATDPGSHPLAGSSSLYVNSPGAISGGSGHGFYAKAGNVLPMAAFYGPNDNAVAFLDSNAFSDSAAGYSGSTELWTAMGSWMYDTALEASLAGPGGLTAVPEPSTYGVIGAFALLALVGRRTIRRRRA